MEVEHMNIFRLSMEVEVEVQEEGIGVEEELV